MFETGDSATTNVSISIKHATARWKLPEKTNPLENKKTEQKVHSQENAPNEQKTPTLCNLNINFLTGKLIGSLNIKWKYLN